MTNLREAQLEARLRDAVRSMGGLIEKLAPTRWGIPDRIVLLPYGQIYLVELKADAGRVRPAQSVWHTRAASLGTDVVVIRGASELDRWIAEQRFILRKKMDATLTKDEHRRYPNDPGTGMARPYRVEVPDGKGGWKSAFTYRNETTAMSRVRMIDGPSRVVFRGEVLHHTGGRPERPAQSA